MLLLFLTPLLISAITRAVAYEAVDRTELAEGEPAPKVNVIEPGSNVIVKLDCAGCPFAIRNGYPRFDEEFDSRPNSLVCLSSAD